MAQGSIYTLHAELKDNISAPLNNVTNQIKNSAKQTEKASRDVKQFQNSISSCTGALSGFANSLKSGDFSGFAQGAVNAGIAVKNLGPILTGLKANLAAITAEVTTATGGLNLLIAGIVAIGAGAAKSNIDLQKSQQGVKSLLGVSDEVLDEYTQSAIEMSKGTSRAAGEILDAFTLIGSQAPQLLDDKEGLEGVTKAAMTLSTAAKMELVDSAKAITTSMNQMGLEASEAGNIIDVMSTAAQKGAGDIQYQVDALNKSGAAAKLAKMSFSELIASIEGVATSFPSAEMAGTKLNAVFVKLEAQTNQNFKPSVVGLIPALRNLEAANLSAADKVKLFGQGNLVAAEALIKNRDSIAQMNQQLQQHGTALQMAETNADTLEAKWNKLTNAFSTLFAELGQSEIIKVLVDALEMLCVVLTKAIQIIGKILHPLLEFFNWINKIANALAQKLIPHIVDAVKNGLDYFRKGWANLINAVGNNALVRNITKIFNKAVDIVLKAIAKIKQLWNDFLKWLGLSSTKVEAPKVKFEQVSETNTETVTATPTGGGKGKGGKGSKAGKTSKTIEPVEGSLGDLEKRLSKLQNDYKNGLIKLLPADYKKQVEDLERQILAKKIELGIEFDVKDALKQLSSISVSEQVIEAQIKTEDPKDLVKQIDILTKSISDTRVKLYAELDDNEAISEIIELENQINELKGKEAKLKVNLETEINGQVDGSELKKIEEIEAQIQGLESKKEEIVVKITPEVNKDKLQEILKLNQQINSLKEKRIQIEAEVNTTISEDKQFSISELNSQLKKLEDQRHQINVGLGFDTKEVDNSLKGIQSRLSAFKDKLSLVDPNDTALIEYINQQIKDLTKQEKEIKIKVGLETKPAEGSLKDIQNKLSEANNKLQLTDPNDLALIAELKKQIDELTKQEKEIKFTLGIDKKPAEGSLKDIQDKLSKKQAELSATIVGTPEYYALIKEINDLEKEEHKIKLKMDTNSLNDYEKKIKEIEKSQNVWNSVGSTVRSFGDAMNAIGNVTDDQTAKVLAGFASIASAIAELIPQIMALIAAKEGQALAEGTASAAGIGFPQNIAAIAAVVASILGVIGTIASISKGFAQGGIVNGSSTVGDHMIARLNAGEMVLNNRQQQRLWNIINGNGSYNNSPREMTVGQVRIKGSDLFLALKNYSKHQRKLGIDTGIK